MSDTIHVLWVRHCESCSNVTFKKIKKILTSLKKEIYNKGGHSILEVKFNLTYKPRPKPIIGPKPDYTLLRNKKTKKLVASALLTNINDTLNNNDTIDIKASKMRDAAHTVITNHLTPPPDNNNTDSLPKYFSERTKKAIIECLNNNEIAFINLDDKYINKNK